ncbi:WAT1-related protein [Quillaja saponaria]|uniref:WAT1-related protein n=1 Tax=Quillaja saponaria TaxID=32244 RepID=A0AAD7Q7X8_QUISA|nr:WAT1-related protein [Quillaja saponaria]
MCLWFTGMPLLQQLLLPLLLFLRGKSGLRLHFQFSLQIFVLGLLGPVIDQNFYYAGLKFTSPTFSCAMSNMLPAMTFVMAVLCRMEKVNIRKIRCQAKVIGTVVTVAGAMLMTLYKGQVIDFLWANHIHHLRNTPSDTNGSRDKDWVKGSILLIFATLAWASFFIIQAVTMRRYSAQLSLTALVCFMGTLQSIAVTFVMEHKPSAWTIGWDINLLAAAYAGIVSSSLAYYVQGRVMKKRGPVFCTAFSPLMMIIVAVMGSFILAEKIYLGGILGAILIVFGLYAVLWGKYKEYKEEIPEPIKGTGGNGKMVTVMEDIEANHMELQKNTEASEESLPVVAISGPIPQPPMISMEAPKA